MNISGIHPYASYNQIDSVSSRAAGTAAESTSASGSSSAQSAEGAQQNSRDRINEAKSRQTFGTYDFANQYRPEENFEMKGADSDLRTLDVERAISDMQKDEVLHQYQFFVGESAGAGAVASQPTERGGENFSL